MIFSRSAVSVAFALSAGLAFSGCGKKTETVYIPKDIWGSSDGYVSVAKASPTVQKAGSAVAQVQSIYIGGGTGFFISSDGLFVTNHHVIPRDACSQERCTGYRIVRNAAVGGDYEVFYDFDIIAQDADYDFTLLKVHLPKGKSVPYLKIDFEVEALEDLGEFNSTYAILGHPALSSLHYAPVVPIELSDERLKFKGLFISGNSGGPIIDKQSGKVLAIGHSSRYEEFRTKRGFSLAVENYATSMLAILNRLKLIFGERSIFDEASVQAFLTHISANYNAVNHKGYPKLVREQLLPNKMTNVASAKRLASGVYFLPLFVNQFIGTNLEAQFMQLGFPANPKEAKIGEEYEKLLSPSSKFMIFEIIGNKLGRVLPFTKQQVEYVAESQVAHFTMDPEIFRSYGVKPKRNNLGQNVEVRDCIVSASDGEKEITLPPEVSLFTIFQCEPNSGRLRRVLNAVLQDHATSNRSADETIMSDFPVPLIIMKSLLQRKVLDSSEIAELVSFANKLMATNVNVQEALMMEGLMTTLITRPELALKGNWREPRKHTFLEGK